MTRKRLLMAASLLVVIVLATTARALVGAWQPRTPALAQPGGWVTETKSVTYSRGQGPRRVHGPLELFGHGNNRVMRWGSLSVEQGGGQVFVKGHAELLDSTLDRRYVWLLRVYSDDVKKLLINEHHYIAQSLFLTEDNLHAKPEFSDTIDDLAPGKYLVRLILYEVPRNFDFAQVQPGENMGTYGCEVSSFKHIIVTE
jgi:hypothetical protein